MRRWIALVAAVLLAACEATVDQSPLPTVMVLATETPLAIAAQPPSTQFLPFYEPVSGELAEGEADVWEFAARQNDQLRIRAVSDQIVALLLLSDSLGSVISEGPDIETIIRRDGVYTLRVTSSQGAGGYQLGLSYINREAPVEPTFTALPQIVGVPTPTPPYAGLGSFVSELRDGETVPSEFQPAAGPQVFSFSGKAGQYANLALDPVSGDAELFMTLYDPEAVAIAADGLSDNGAGILRDILLATGGTYSLRVESNGQPATFTMALRLRDVPVAVTPTYNVTPTPTLATPVLTPDYEVAQIGERLSPEQPVLAEISAASPVNTHSFSLRAGDIVTVAISPVADSPLIPRVEIIDPDGQPVITVFGNLSPFDRDAIVSPLVANLDGPYTLFVTGEGQTEGKYTAAYGYGSTKENVFKGEAQPDRANISTMSRRATAEVWHIVLSKGDLISAGITPMDGNIIPVLELYSGEGQLLGIDSESGGYRSPFVSGIRIPESGLYLLKVRPANASSIGAYQLVWRYLDLGPTPTPVPGTLPILTVEDSVAPEDYVFYPFAGRAGQQIIVVVRASDGSTLDPVAAVIGLDGTIIGEGDDSSGTLDVYFEMTLPADGTYQLRVNGYLSSGDFRATVIAVYY